MSGKIKHIQRSHRSYGSKIEIFNSFHRSAIKMSDAKARKDTSTLIGKIIGLFTGRKKKSISNKNNKRGN